MQKILRAGSSEVRLWLFSPPVSWYWWRGCQRRDKALRLGRQYHNTLHWYCLESVYSRVEKVPMQSVLLRDQVCSLRLHVNVASETIWGQNIYDTWYIRAILPWTCQRILSNDYGFTTTEDTTTTSGDAEAVATAAEARPNEQKTQQGGNTNNGLPTPPVPKLGENLLQINVYLDTLSEQIIATTATYSMVMVQS